MQDPQEFDGMAELAPYLEILKRFAGLDFAAGMPLDGWKELARTLREVSGDNRKRAARIVDEFLRAPRCDEKGNLETKVPTPIELRMFARGVPEQPIPEGDLPMPCAECAPYGGLHRVVDRWGYSAADRCLCERGEALRARDEARKAGSGPRKQPAKTELRSMADFAKRAARDLE